MWFFSSYAWQVNTTRQNTENTASQEKKSNTSGVLDRTEDTTVKRVVAWRYSEHFSPELVTLDTVLPTFYERNPSLQRYIMPVYLGRLGSAAKPIAFFSEEPPTFFLSRYYRGYMNTSEDVLFYNTTTPYSNIKYSTGTNKNRKSEETGQIMYTRNYSKNRNIGFDINLYNYIQDLTSTRTYKALNTKTWASFNWKDYALYMGFLSNRLTINETGGVIDETNLNLQPSEDYQYKLDDSYTNFWRNTFFLRQELIVAAPGDTNQFGFTDYTPLLKLCYAFTGNWNRHTFTNNMPADSFISSITDTFPLFSGDKLIDTNSYTQFKHLIELNISQGLLRKFSLSAYIEIEKEIYGMYVPRDTLRMENNSYNNFATGVRTLGTFGDWSNKLTGHFVFAGRKIGNVSLVGNITKRLKSAKDTSLYVTIRGALSNERASFYEERYFGSYNRWNNDFLPKQTIKGSIELNSLKRILTAHLDLGLLTNYIYFNSKGSPVQHDKAIFLAQATIDKVWQRKWYYNRVRAIASYTPSSVIRFPALAIDNTFAFTLKLQHVKLAIGSSMRWNPKYYADGYMPSTSQFILQNNKKIGGYFLLSPFFSFQVKRLQAFVKMVNVVPQWTNYNYYSAYNYPLEEDQLIRFGFSWNFYN